MYKPVKKIDKIKLKDTQEHKYILDHAKGRPFTDVLAYAALPFFEIVLDTGASIMYTSPAPCHHIADTEDADRVIDVYFIDDGIVYLWLTLLKAYNDIGFEWRPVLCEYDYVRDMNTLSQMESLLYAGVQNIFLNRPEAIVSEDHPVSDTKAVKKNGKYKEVKYTRIVKYYSLESEEVRCHFIKCDCWGVAGHWRHYKSGKSVFISPYKKGINRDKKEPSNKTYLLGLRSVFKKHE